MLGQKLSKADTNADTSRTRAPSEHDWEDVNTVDERGSGKSLKVHTKGVHLEKLCFSPFNSYYTFCPAISDLTIF
jgi:hypothetical protein